jgi:hypothetical protein
MLMTQFELAKALGFSREKISRNIKDYNLKAKGTKIANNGRETSLYDLHDVIEMLSWFKSNKKTCGIKETDYDKMTYVPREVPKNMTPASALSFDFSRCRADNCNKKGDCARYITEKKYETFIKTSHSKKCERFIEL